MTAATPPDTSRREFLQAAAVGALALTAGNLPAAEKAALPQREYGKTGVKVPILGLGTAPAGHRPEKDAVAFFHRCIDSGLTYLDTAPQFAGYGKAQVYLGQVLKERRKEVFLITKCAEPNGEKALALLKKNLAELQTDHADVVYAHSIGDDNMPPEKIYAADGVCKALAKAKKDGLTRFVGVSGHCRPERFLKALQEWYFDVMMTAVSLVARHIYNFEEKVWPAAAKKEVALVAMKVFGGAPGGDKTPKGARLPADYLRSALRYALGLPKASLAVVGIHDDDELKQELEWVRDYKPLTTEELTALDKPSRELAGQWKAVYGPVT
jgi:aryl-alcohol dehydrogenase-like predicted oxidoreductase